MPVYPPGECRKGLPKFLNSISKLQFLFIYCLQKTELESTLLPCPSPGFPPQVQSSFLTVYFKAPIHPSIQP